MSNILKWIENSGLNTTLSVFFGVLCVSTVWIFSQNVFQHCHIIAMAIAMYCSVFFAKCNNSGDLEHYLDSNSKCARGILGVFGFIVIFYSTFTCLIVLLMKLVDFVSRIQIVYN